jgi:hypothetical protein
MGGVPILRSLSVLCYSEFNDFFVELIILSSNLQSLPERALKAKQLA